MLLILIGLFDRDVAVIEMALSRGIPCTTVIGGGYDDDIDVLGRRHSIIHRAAIKVSGEKTRDARLTFFDAMSLVRVVRVRGIVKISRG